MIVTGFREKTFDLPDPVFLIGGFMRSGTSMMMRIMDFAGVPVVWDTEHLENNKYGCFEIGGLDNTLLVNGEWIKQHQGKCLKASAYDMYLLPCFSYKMIFMDRDETQIARSFYSMSAGYTYEEEDREVEHLTEYKRCLRHFLSFRHDIKVLEIPFDNVFKETDRTLNDIAKFLDVPFNIEKAKEAIDRSLYVIR